MKTTSSRLKENKRMGRISGQEQDKEKRNKRMGMIASGRIGRIGIR
jgi:hypothetical protein